MARIPYWKTLSVGDRFGRLTVINPDKKATIEHERKRGVRYIECLCDCGKTTQIVSGNLKRGNTKSCGCWRRDFGLSKGYRTKEEYRILGILYGMISRCHNIKDTNYYNYGGRGLFVCEEWRSSSEAFLAWAKISGHKQGLQIDRIDNNKGYFPDNCRWATSKQNCRNTRSNHHLTAWGETKTMAEWAEDPRCKAKYVTLRNRINHGVSAELAIAAPAYHQYGGKPTRHFETES